MNIYDWEMVKDREAGNAAVHGVAKSQTRLSDLTTTTTTLYTEMKIESDSLDSSALNTD